MAIEAAHTTSPARDMPLARTPTDDRLDVTENGGVSRRPTIRADVDDDVADDVADDVVDDDACSEIVRIEDAVAPASAHRMATFVRTIQVSK